MSVTVRSSEPHIPTVLNLHPSADFVETPAVYTLSLIHI